MKVLRHDVCVCVKCMYRAVPILAIKRCHFVFGYLTPLLLRFFVLFEIKQNSL